jgi:hypothetical protein
MPLNVIPLGQTTTDKKPMITIRKYLTNKMEAIESYLVNLVNYPQITQSSLSYSKLSNLTKPHLT